MISPACFLALEVYKSWMVGRFVPVQFSGRSKPDSDGCAENRLNDCSVKLDQQLLRQVVLPELTCVTSLSKDFMTTDVRATGL